MRVQLEPRSSLSSSDLQLGESSVSCSNAAKSVSNLEGDADVGGAPRRICFWRLMPGKCSMGTAALWEAALRGGGIWL